MKLSPVAGLILPAVFSVFLPFVHGAEPSTFTITIDEAQWKHWGFRYPVTYVFEITGVGEDVKASRRDGERGAWLPLKEKSAGDFFNGIECARFDRRGGKAYVSVGYGDANLIELQFTDVASAKFVSVAKYYDDRRGAYTLSIDNWGCRAGAHPGAPWKGSTSDASDNYQAALHACRSFHLPVSIAINTHMAGGEAVWSVMQKELDLEDCSWEPAVHGRTHPMNAAEYAVNGYAAEILGCREDILKRLKKIPYGQHIFEHILTTGYVDDSIMQTDAGEFLFVRGFNNSLNNSRSNAYVQWNSQYRFYGVGGLSTKAYDRVLERREPKGRFNTADVSELNGAFDDLMKAGGVFYALWHPDRYRNSIIYDPSQGVDGRQGSTLMRHLAHVANRKDVWYAANGWLYSYRYVAENVRVK